MQRKDVISIADVLRECLEKSRMQLRLDELHACECFAMVVGEHIASSCGAPSMRDGVMTVATQNAPLRSELNMHRAEIMHHINDISGKLIVKDIRFR